MILFITANTDYIPTALIFPKIANRRGQISCYAFHKNWRTQKRDIMELENKRAYRNGHPLS